MNYLNLFLFSKRKFKNSQTGRPFAGQAGLQAGHQPEGSGLWPAQAGAQAGWVSEAVGPWPAHAEPRPGAQLWHRR